MPRRKSNLSQNTKNAKRLRLARSRESKEGKQARLKCNQERNSFSRAIQSYVIYSRLSDSFIAKLQDYKTNKLRVLFTMESDFFYDGTVYTGSAGFALYHFMCSLGKNDHNYEHLMSALDYINLESLKQRRISFLCGDAGPLALATVISYKMGTRRPNNLPDYKALAQRLLSLVNLLNNSPDELLYGKSGYLYALLFVNKHIIEEDVIPANHIEKVVEAILNSGKQFAIKMKSDTPLLWQWHDKIYFGAAHGMAGILYMLLQARSYINKEDEEIRSYIKPTLDWLLRHQLPSGNFPSSLGSSSGDRLVQWCHGAPGFVPLCLLAHQIFNEDVYLNIALQCGDVIWRRGLCSKGYSLCHGVSGNAYAFLQLYQATKNRVHLYRACCFMDWCIMEHPNSEGHSPDRPASLFEGLVGRLYLAEDLTRHTEARFPGLCL